MLRWMIYLSITALLLYGCASISWDFADSVPLLPAAGSLAATGSEAASVDTCAVTATIMDQPPDDPNADPFGYGNWQVNDERTIWVDIPPSGKWHTGGEKVIWIRPAATELRISGQRLDGEADPLRVDAPCCYPTGFEVNGLYFPTEGCWEVTANAGAHELRFVIEVEEGNAASAQREARGIDPSSPLATSVLLQDCNSSSCDLRLFDTERGAIVEEVAPLALGHYATFGPSPDLTQLALIVYTDNHYLRNGRLEFLDLATWETVTTTLTFDGAYNTPLFTTDNARLLVVTQEEVVAASDVVHLVDVATGTLLAEQTLDFYPTNYQFTADESGVMFFGTKGSSGRSYVALLDATSLGIVWETEVEGLLNGQVLKEGSSDPLEGMWWQPAAAFAPESATLYVVHADQEALTTVDFSAQRITTQEISKPLSWVERLLMLTAHTAYAKMANGVNKQATLSPDGTQLYVIGTRYSVEENEANGPEFMQIGLGLQVIDHATGTLHARVETEAQSLSIDESGGRLFLHGWTTEDARPYTTEWTEVLDTDTLEMVNLIEQKAVAVAHRLDGTPILLSTTTLENGQTELAVLDPETLEVISSSADWYGGYVGWVELR